MNMTTTVKKAKVAIVELSTLLVQLFNNLLLG